MCVCMHVCACVLDDPWYSVWISDPGLIDVNMSEVNSTSQNSSVVYEVGVALMPYPHAKSSSLLAFSGIDAGDRIIRCSFPSWLCGLHCCAGLQSGYFY